jgi:hypothetical protein
MRRRWRLAGAEARVDPCGPGSRWSRAVGSRSGGPGRAHARAAAVTGGERVVRDSERRREVEVGLGCPICRVNHNGTTAQDGGWVRRRKSGDLASVTRSTTVKASGTYGSLTSRRNHGRTRRRWKDGGCAAPATAALGLSVGGSWVCGAG